MLPVAVRPRIRQSAPVVVAAADVVVAAADVVVAAVSAQATGHHAISVLLTG